MRLTINKERFLAALANAYHAIAPKNPVAVLSNFKLDLTERGMEVTGSNNEITIRSTVPYILGDRTIITNVVRGSAMVDARMMTEIVRRMEGDTIFLDIVDNAVAKIEDGHSLFRINCASADEYPDIDLEPSGTELTIPCNVLADLVSQSAFAASGKEQRAILTALNLEAKDGVLTATATDSARLARKSVKIDSDVSFRTNIPARFLTDIVRLMEGALETRIFISDKKALFMFDGNVVSTRLIPGDYQVTRSIIPTVCNYKLQVNSQELLNAMGRIAVLSADKEYAVKLSMSEDHVEVSVKSDRHGSGNEPIKTFSYEGERLEVTFNSLFVIDAIKALKAEDVTICFQAEMRPFVVKDPKDDSAIELITPMHAY